MFWYACMLAARPYVTAPIFLQDLLVVLACFAHLLRLLRHSGWSWPESEFVTSTALLRTA